MVGGSESDGSVHHGGVVEGRAEAFVQGVSGHCSPASAPTEPTANIQAAGQFLERREDVEGAAMFLVVGRMIAGGRRRSLPAVSAFVQRPFPFLLRLQTHSLHQQDDNSVCDRCDPRHRRFQSGRQQSGKSFST